MYTVAPAMAARANSCLRAIEKQNCGKVGSHQPLSTTLQQGGRYAGSALAHLAGPSEHGGGSGLAAAAWRRHWGSLWRGGRA